MRTVKCKDFTITFPSNLLYLSLCLESFHVFLVWKKLYSNTGRFLEEPPFQEQGVAICSS